MMIRILSGSPLPLRTNSRAIAEWLAARVVDAGGEAEILELRALLGDPQAQGAILDHLDANGILVMVVPVFFDGPPAQMLGLLAALADARPARSGGRLVIVAHSGYPEHSQRAVTIETLRRFADEAGISVLGALGFGGTSPIGGRDLDKAGFFARTLRASLRPLATELVHQGRVGEASRAAASSESLGIPRWLITPMLNLLIRRKARAAGLDLHARPFIG